MFVNRKPWKYGKEYHTICCRLLGILFGLKLTVKVFGNPAYNENGGSACGLLLRMTRPIWVSERSCSSPRWDNLPSGHQRNPLFGLILWYMYWGQKHSSE